MSPPNVTPAALAALKGMPSTTDRSAARAVLLLAATTVALLPAVPPSDGMAAGTKLTLRGSEFGRMIFGPNRQAVYVFQRDGRNRSRCFGACARLWPPVYTNGKPTAGPGLRPKLLGTIRRGGRRQVTYRGRPLYYYAHEGPGEVRCHNVNLNGGLWWVIGADGRRRP